MSEKQENKSNIELENLKKENRELKFLVAEKELSIRVLNELLKKTLDKFDRLLVAQSCIDNQIPIGLVLKLCQISRSSFYYKPTNKDKKAGRNPFLRTGGFVTDTIVIAEINKLFTQEFVDYGYYKTTIFLKK